MSTHCEALKQGRVDELPPPKVRAARKRLELAVAVCRRNERLLVARRPEAGLFGGLWELPTADSVDALAKLLRGAKPGAHLGTIERTLTHRDLVLQLYTVQSRATFQRLAGYSECRWVTRRQIEPLGVSAAMQEVLERAWTG